MTIYLIEKEVIVSKGNEITLNFIVNLIKAKFHMNIPLQKFGIYVWLIAIFKKMEYPLDVL